MIQNPDVILIGSGIMSATLGSMLKQLRPEISIQVYEATDGLAMESSQGWNNAGTGHAGICELSYTPSRAADGTVDVSKAVDIFAEFAHSKQFWGHATTCGMLANPAGFIRAVPHISFVTGAEQVEFLRARHTGLLKHHFFRSMEFTSDPEVIAGWAPLLMEGRGGEPVAATRMDSGTDVNFGLIAAGLLQWLGLQRGCSVSTGCRVTGLEKNSNGGWRLRIRNSTTGTDHENTARFVFVGAGGGSLPLLRKAGIPEGKGVGGFPISGQWLVCENPEIVNAHHAKVYGQALGAAPTMAVPHLDTRHLEGRRTLLFGPFAAWTTKFLYGSGSRLDLPRSVGTDNLSTLLKVGLKNAGLVRYLISQGLQSMEHRMESLRQFYPAARAADWRLVDAGIRVQAIRKIDGIAGIVHYGTEIVTTRDLSMAALLGASPGASVSAHIILQVLDRCFPDLLQSPEGRTRLAEMVPAWLEDGRLPENAGRFSESSRRAETAMGLI